MGYGYHDRYYRFHSHCTAKFTDSKATTSKQYLISSGSSYNFTAEAKTGWKLDS